MDDNVYYLSDIYTLYGINDNTTVFYPVTFVSGEMFPGHSYENEFFIESENKLDLFLKEHLVSYNQTMKSIKNLKSDKYITMGRSIFLDNLKNTITQYYDELPDEIKLKIELLEEF